jgi:hypothetical protein
VAKNDKSLDLALSNAIDDLLRDYRGAMKEAIKFAAKQAEEDLMAKAKTCLQEYYESYDPTERYDRTKTLQYAFLPYSNIQYKQDSVVGKVGVEYEPLMIEMMMPNPVYYTGRDGSKKISHEGYYGSSNYQPVDASWVLDNYLKGIHPVTNGGRTSETAIYYEVYDVKSPNQKMNEFIKSYDKTFDENVLLALLGQIAKKMS